MIHFLTEGGDGNKELKNRRWFLPDGVRHHLEKVKDDNEKDKLSKNPTTKEAWDHLEFILGEEKGISYNEMKRIKNWFDKNQKATKTKQYELYGGEIMKTWVDDQLSSASLIVKQHKEALKAAGKSNAFIKAHDADRQTTATKVDTKVPTYNPATQNKQNRLKELSAIKENKILVINEHQNNLIKEAINDKIKSDFFNELETYASLDNYNQCVSLCHKYLGRSIGTGSSRFVFQIDDEKVLKVASGEKGVAQNKAEVEAYNTTTMYKAIFPIVFNYSKNYTYIITEYVLPLSTLRYTDSEEKHDDYLTCLGVTESEFEEIIKEFDYCISSNKINWDALKQTKMFSVGEGVTHFVLQHIKENKNFALLMYYLIENPALCRESFNYDNMGMTRRNGKPWIVILDNGWDGNTAETYGYENFGKLNV